MEDLAPIVLHKLRETFPVELQPAAEALLRSYEETSTKGRGRIQLAVIRLTPRMLKVHSRRFRSTEKNRRSTMSQLGSHLGCQ